MFASFIITSTFVKAQIGVGVSNPLTDFHISSDNPDGGGIQIDGSIYLGGDVTTLGDSGSEGQVMTIGANGRPEWSGGNGSIDVTPPSGTTYSFHGCDYDIDTSSIATIHSDEFLPPNPTTPKASLVTAMASSDIISIYTDATFTNLYSSVTLPDPTDPVYLNRNFLFFVDERFLIDEDASTGARWIVQFIVAQSDATVHQIGVAHTVNSVDEYFGTASFLNSGLPMYLGLPYGHMVSAFYTDGSTNTLPRVVAAYYLRNIDGSWLAGECKSTAYVKYTSP